MLEFRARFDRTATTSKGEREITFVIEKGLESIVDGLNSIKNLMLVAKEYTEKKSKNANSYFWVLCGKLADKLNASDIDIYRSAIRDVGVCRTEELDETDPFNKTMIHMWNSYGKGWFVERLDFGKKDNMVLMKFYYGSSSYNSKQMSRLIDYIVEECKEQEIETLSPDKLSLLKEEWGK